MTIRMFTALLPPPDIAAEIETAVQGLHHLPGTDRLRWTDPAARHITLAFYGETDEAKVPDLHARLARAARRTEPFDIRLSGGGRFGDSALWAAVTEGRSNLTRLAERAAAAGRRAGAGPAGTGRGGRETARKERRYHPHLTLARSRRAGPPLAGYVAVLDELRSSRWHADQLALIRSVLPSGGTAGEQPQYVTVAVCPLGR